MNNIMNRKAINKMNVQGYHEKKNEFEINLNLDVYLCEFSQRLGYWFIRQLLFIHTLFG